MAGLTVTQRDQCSHAQRPPRARPDKVVGQLLGIVLAVLGASAAAYGQPASVQIVWNAPAACPSREAVVDEVTRILGHTVTGPVTLARADVSSDERGRWRAALSIESRGGASERELEAETCPAIASAVALIVAVANERGLPSEPAPASTSPASMPPHPARPVLTRYQSKLLVGVDAAVDGFPGARTIPGFAVGPDASVGWLYASGQLRFAVLGTGTYFPPVRASAMGEQADFDLLAAAARACVGVTAGRFDLGPCVGSELNSMRASNIREPAQAGTQTLAFHEASAEWWSLVGSALAHWNLSRSFAFAVRTDALVSPSRPVFERSPGTPVVVFRPSLVTIRAALGVEMFFF
jgi:hypothetical protein